MIFSYFLNRFENIEFDDFVFEYGTDLVSKTLSQWEPEVGLMSMECRWPFIDDMRFGELIFSFRSGERFAIILNGSKKEIEVTVLQKSAPDWSWGYFTPILCIEGVDKSYRRFQMEVVCLLFLWLVVHQDRQKNISLSREMIERIRQEKLKFESLLSLSPPHIEKAKTSAEISNVLILDEHLDAAVFPIDSQIKIQSASHVQRVSSFFNVVSHRSIKNVGFSYREKLLLKNVEAFKIFFHLSDGSILRFEDWESSPHFVVKTKVMKLLHEARSSTHSFEGMSSALQFLWGWTHSKGTLFFISSDPRTIRGMANVCEVKEVLWEPSENFKIHLELLSCGEMAKRQFRFSMAHPEIKKIFNEQFCFQIDSRQLSFVNFSSFNQHVSQWIEDHYFDFQQTNWSLSAGQKFLDQLQEKSELTFFLEGHFSISEALGFFNKFSLLVTFNFPEVVSLAPHFRSRLEVDREQMQICTDFEVQDSSCRFHNFHEMWAWLSCGWQEGLISVVHVPLEDAISRKRGDTRQNDLKVLKHSGFYHFLILEILSYFLFGKDTLEHPLEKVQNLLEVIYMRGGFLVFKEERPSSEMDLRERCSSKVVDLVKNFVNECLILFNEPTTVFLESSEICLQGLHRHHALFFYRFLKVLVDSSRGDLLLRKKSKQSAQPLITDQKPLEVDFGYEDFFSLQQSFLWNRPILSKKWKDLGHKLGVSEVSRENLGLFEKYARWNERRKIIGNPNLSFLLAKEEKAKVSPLIYFFLSSDEKPLFSDLQWLSLFSSSDPYSVSLRGMNVIELNERNLEVRLGVAGEESRQATVFDWFELNPQFFLNGKEISIDLAQKLSFEGVIEYQGQLYRIDKRTLPKWRVLDQFWERLQSSKTQGRRGQGGFTERVFRLQALEILALKAMGHDIEGDGQWQNLIEHYEKLGRETLSTVLPNSLKSVLKDYQKVGVHWLCDLYDLRLGGILADDMGLGKTLQSLAFLASLKQQKKMKKALIIIPASLVFGWKKECEKFTPELKIKVFEGRSELEKEAVQNWFDEAEVVLCTYHLLTLYNDHFKSQIWDVVIFDEAQNLKTMSTKRHEAAKKVQANFKIALTGTPLENHLLEFYSILNVVVPGSLGGVSQFKTDYNPEKNDFVERVQFLKLKLKPLVLRRKKQEVLKELAEKSEIPIEVPFIKKQKELYKKIALSWNQTVQQSVQTEGVGKSQMAMLTALLRLRQVCSDPAGIPDVKFPEIPPKLELVADRIEELVDEGHSVVVFTQFIATLNRVAGLFAEKKIIFDVLHGSMNRKAREQALENFNREHPEQKGKALLMTLKTGGVGLNLTKASYVFHLDPWWNPAAENQASDRVHRIGQKKSVFVYRLIMKESVEEKMELLKQRKSLLFQNIFGDDFFNLENAQGLSPSEVKASLSKEDFDYLLGLGED